MIHKVQVKPMEFKKGPEASCNEEWRVQCGTEQCGETSAPISRRYLYYHGNINQLFLLLSYLIFIFVNKGGHSVALDGFDLHGQLHSQLARFCRALVAYLLHARRP